MLSKEKTAFIIICCVLGISLPLLWSRYTSNNQDLPLLTWKPLPAPQGLLTDSKWVIDLRNKGFSLHNLPDKSQLWSRNIHLCIMFNLNNIKPNPNSTDLLLVYYFPFFNHITLIFDGKWDKKPDYLPEYVDFYGCDSHIGWYQHKCLNICLSHPGDDNVEGFFYIADDMYINWSNLASFNRSQTWYMPTAVYNYNEIITMDKNEVHKLWMWWGPPLSFEKVLKVVIDTLPQGWINQLKTNVGFPDEYQMCGIFDIIYLPRSLAPKMTEVITHIVKTGDLFCELAGPLAVGIVVPKEEKLLFTTSFLWGNQRNAEMIIKKSQTVDLVHPVKLSVPDQAAIWRERMDQQLVIAANQTHH